jgi:hypothetical protein
MILFNMFSCLLPTEDERCARRKEALTQVSRAKGQVLGMHKF